MEMEMETKMEIEMEIDRDIAVNTELKDSQTSFTLDGVGTLSSNR